MKSTMYHAQDSFLIKKMVTICHKNPIEPNTFLVFGLGQSYLTAETVGCVSWKVICWISFSVEHYLIFVLTFGNLSCLVKKETYLLCQMFVNIINPVPHF